MTNQNRAAQAIQEAERIAAADEYFKARAWLMDTNDNRRIFEAGFDRAYALLSQVRAPVADERAAFARAITGRDDLEPHQVENVIDANLTRWTTWRAARDYYQQARAALASAPVAPAEVMDALNWVDDFIARCNRDDRGSCDSVNVLRRALAGAPVDDAGNWQQYRLRGSNETAEQIIERERTAYADLLQSVMDKRRERASAPVAGEQFKAAFPNGALTAARFHELWESAGHNPNPDRTLLENLAWQVGKFAGLVAKEASAPVAGEAVGWSGWACQYPNKLPRLYGAKEIAQLNCDAANGDRVLFLSEHAAPQASAEDVRNAALVPHRQEWANRGDGYGHWVDVDEARFAVLAPECRRTLYLPQADKDGCTCPSGDGSLRHPCPAHPKSKPPAPSQPTDKEQA